MSKDQVIAVVAGPLVALAGVLWFRGRSTIARETPPGRLPSGSPWLAGLVGVVFVVFGVVLTLLGATGVVDMM